MSARFDIRAYKKQLRARYRATRCELGPLIKQEKDKSIREHVMNLPVFRASRTILCYVSMPLEIDTHVLIQKAVAQGKTVAVPYCVEDSREMKFYRIRSIDELVPRTFGVLEPVPEQAEELTDYSASVCLLPGLCFDGYGYRLGYGGGYYDRFLSQVYRGTTIGLCYYECTRPYIIHGRYDVPCHYIVTENGARKAKPYRVKKEQAPKKQGP